METSTAVAVHVHGDGPVSPVVRKDEDHGNDLAVYHAIDDGSGDERRSEQHDEGLEGKWRRKAVERDFRSTRDGDQWHEAPGGNLDKGLEPAQQRPAVEPPAIGGREGELACRAVLRDELIWDEQHG